MSQLCCRLNQIDYDRTNGRADVECVDYSLSNETIVYPNPAQDEAIVATMGDKELESLTLKDLYGNDITGKIPWTRDSGIYTLDVRALRNGTYYIE